MSVNAALQQGASAGANVLAGVFVTRTPGGQLAGLPTLGYASIGFFLLTVLLAAQLRAAAPHVAAPSPRHPVVPASTEAAV
jgi:hypothetical protein